MGIWEWGGNTVISPPTKQHLLHTPILITTARNRLELNPIILGISQPNTIVKPVQSVDIKVLQVIVVACQRLVAHDCEIDVRCDVAN